MSLRPRELGRDHWILSFFSLRYADFDTRVEAAAAAGFDGIGLFIGQYLELTAAGRSDADLLRVLEAHGLVVAEIEALIGWAGSPEARKHSAKWLDTACHMGDVFGARHLQAVGPYEGPLDGAAESFAHVCDRASSSGLRVALEFFPPTNLPDARSALELVELADRPNGGLCVDSWHHFRGARDEAQLRAIPGARVVSIQLNDGTLEPEHPDFMTDTLENRRVPGEGEFDLAGLARILGEIGTTAPRSLEVISRPLQALPPTEAAKRILEGARLTFSA